MSQAPTNLVGATGLQLQDLQLLETMINFSLALGHSTNFMRLKMSGYVWIAKCLAKASGVLHCPAPSLPVPLP